MKDFKFNKIMGIILGILCFISCVANYFGVFVFLAIAAVFSLFVAFFAMRQVYQYQKSTGYNPGYFWEIYTICFGFIILYALCTSGFEKTENHVGIAIVTGLIPTLIPLLGAFLGDFGRVLIKSESSAF